MPRLAFLNANILTTGSLASAGLPGATAASRYVGATASGPPRTNSWLAGDFVVDQSGSFWICTSAGTPGVWVESGNTASSVVQLTDASIISVDASMGNDFRLTLTGNHILDNPTNAVDGERIIFQITQGTGGPYNLSYGTAYAFGTTLPSPTLSSGTGKLDLLGFIYNAAKSKWLFVAYAAGFS